MKHKDYITANRKGSREAEIQRYGKQISMRPTNIHKSKKQYKRTKYKNKDYDE